MEDQVKESTLIILLLLQKKNKRNPAFFFSSTECGSKTFRWHSAHDYGSLFLQQT